MGIPIGSGFGALAVFGASIQTHLREGQSGFRSEMSELMFKDKTAKGGGKAMTQKDKDRLVEMKDVKKQQTKTKKKIKVIKEYPISAADRDEKIKLVALLDKTKGEKEAEVMRLNRLPITSPAEKAKLIDAINVEIAERYTKTMTREQ